MRWWRKLAALSCLGCASGNLAAPRSCREVPERIQSGASSLEASVESLPCAIATDEVLTARICLTNRSSAEVTPKGVTVYPAASGTQSPRTMSLGESQTLSFPPIAPGRTRCVDVEVPSNTWSPAGDTYLTIGIRGDGISSVFRASLLRVP